MHICINTYIYSQITMVCMFIYFFNYVIIFLFIENNDKDKVHMINSFNFYKSYNNYLLLNSQ